MIFDKLCFKSVIFTFKITKPYLLIVNCLKVLCTTKGGEFDLPISNQYVTCPIRAKRIAIKETGTIKNITL